MKSVSINRGVIVGVFIFLALAILFTAVFTIGNQQKAFEKTILLKAIFDDVNGLQPGNNVWLSGVKIGTVKKIKFSGNSSVEITMNIDESAAGHIQKNAKAKISSDGFIGNRIVVIYGGTKIAENIVNGDCLQSEKGISTDNMLSILQQSNNNLLSITENLRTISEKIKNGNGLLGQLIDNKQMSNNLRSTLTHFKTAAISTQEATAKINSLVMGLDNKGTLINELTTDTFTYTNIKTAIHELQMAAINIAAFTDSLKNASAALSRNDNTVGALLHDKEIADNIKTITKNLNKSSQELDEDLKALQSNFLFRKYFHEQDKQKRKADTITKTKFNHSDDQNH